MRSRIFFPRQMNTTRNVKTNRVARIFSLLGILLFSAGFSGTANAQISFVSGPVLAAPYPIVCNNGTYDLSPLLGVDGYVPGTLNYEIGFVSPAHGTIATLPRLITTTTGVAYPAANTIVYTPTAGYSGSEQMWIKATDGGSNTATIIIFLDVKAAPSINVPSPRDSVCAGTTLATISYSNPVNVGSVSDSIKYTGSTYTFNIPLGVTSIDFDAYGARGGKDTPDNASANPGLGGRIQGTLNVTGASTLDINVGGIGHTGTILGAAGGFNGGGDAAFYFYGAGGAGGGATDIRMNGSTLADRVVVAGGGGGNGRDFTGTLSGGGGGGALGGNGSNNAGGGFATGGSQFAGGTGAVYGGWLPGMPGSFGVGGMGSAQGISGGGGGGYYGGGGGAWSGGAGGSSFAHPVKVTAVSHAQGVNDTSGLVVLKYPYPGSTYSIDWDFTAQGQGFTDVLPNQFTNPLPASPIQIQVPAGALPATYHGVLRVHNSTCDGNPIDIYVTVIPIPDLVIAPAGNQVVCNGQTTLDIDFSGIPGQSEYWTNDHAEIDQSGTDLPATGTAHHIESFVGYNPTNDPIVNTLTITPTYLGCVGATKTMSITVNPTPNLNSATSPAGTICDKGTFNYTSSSLTTGGPVTYAWSRAANADIANPAASGTGDNINEQLFNTSAGPVNVIYVDTIKANGCIATRNLTVRVNPTPYLNDLAPKATCDSTLFTYVPASATSGTTFAWSRDVVTDISNGAAVGMDDPNEYLDNIGLAPVVVTYTYTLSATFNSLTCYNVASIFDTVKPGPVLSSPTSVGPLCDSTKFEYIPASLVAGGATFMWDRIANADISNPATTGSGSVLEYLENITAHPTVVNYVYTIIANGCSNVQTIPLTINPKPLLIGSLSRAPICDSTLFSYLPTSFTVGTSFAWTRAAVTGIANPAGSGMGNPNEVLYDTSANPITVTYLYTLNANGCSNQQNVTVVVNPDPKLSSPLSPAAICDSSTFSYTPTSATTGSAFTWYRPYVPGILQVGASGTNNPNEALINTTNVGINVVYVYTVTANGCSNTQRVTVYVNPTPHLTSAATGTVCSGERFTYAPTSFTGGTTYSWVRNSVTNITPATASGTGTISDSMVNGTLLPINVIYLYRLGINGCLNNHTDKVTVTVKPKAPLPTISIAPPHDLCSNTMYMNFGASSAVPVDYSWSALNATVWATGSTGQYAVVSFPNSGTAVVRLNANLPDVGCFVNSTYTVNVSESVSDIPQIIYFDGQFICLQTNEDSYQWGYDNANTLDSTMLVGETNQNYTNKNPDFGSKKYWIMTTHGGCLQKTYYNVPTGIDDPNDIAGIRVYPNPTSDYVNVDVNEQLNGDIQVGVYNMLGQKVNTAAVQNHKARINVSALPAGVYLIDCYRDGVKLAAARFIKN